MKRGDNEMDEKDQKELCLKLIAAETEDETIEILKVYGLWDDEEAWEDYGGDEFNFRTIGNQQSSADAALIEKIINAIDAVILRETRIRGWEPNDPNAPKSIHEALEIIYEMKNGRLGTLSKKKLKELSEMIQVIASGHKPSRGRSPTFTIIDMGEGQSPDEFENTFLSLSGSNKVNIPWVQGKFNMGSTGVLEFCGRHGLQLIVSRRHELLRDGTNPDSGKWGFTVVRRFEPKGTMKFSVYKYLTINHSIPRFSAESLTVLPEGGTLNPRKNKLEWGSIVKLYNYRLPKSLGSTIKTRLFSRFNVLLPDIPLPVQLWERRDYQNALYPSYLFGLRFRLEEEEGIEILERDFTQSGSIMIKGSILRYSLYVFKEGKKTDYQSKESIILSVNGQTHGFLPKSLFEKAKLSYLKDSIIILVDCTNLERKFQEKLFMNSRDRTRKSEIRDELEAEIVHILKNNKDLKTLEHNRRKRKIQDAVSNGSRLKESLQEIILASKNLKGILPEGKKLSNPIDFRQSVSIEKFEGKQFPTYFRLEKEKKVRKVHQGSRARVYFLTDAENSYFDRVKYPGSFELKWDYHLEPNWTINLNNGRATLNLQIDESIPIDTKIKVTYYVYDKLNEKGSKHHSGTFKLEIKKPAPPQGGNNGTKAKPLGKSGKDRISTDDLDLPNVIHVSKEKWEDHGFTEKSAAKYVLSDEGLDIFINMDNYYLLHFLKKKEVGEVEEIKLRYSNILCLIVIGLIDSVKNKTEDLIIDSPEKLVEDITKNLTTYLLPYVSMNKYQ